MWVSVIHLDIVMSCFYFSGMKNREERSKHFFDSGPLMEDDEDLAVYEKVLALTNYIYYTYLT